MLEKGILKSVGEGERPLQVGRRWREVSCCRGMHLPSALTAAQRDCGDPFLSVQAFHSSYSVHLVSLLNVAPSVKHSQDTLSVPG